MSRLLIPRKTVYRLSLYYRALQQLSAANIRTVSSAALAKAAGVKPTQIRKDLTHFGQFGTRGLGYNVVALRAKLNDALGATRLHPVIIVGAGNLGAALSRYGGFTKEGFDIVAAFDVETSKKQAVGLRVRLLPMRKLGDFVREKTIKLAILAVPGIAAQTVAEELVATGISGILNFSPVILDVPEGVIVNNVDLALELENLSYFVQ